MHKSQRLINHVALVLDGSSSMNGHTRNLIKFADEQVRHLAIRSEELSQETRVSVYLFNNTVECLIFDMDVMRLPSISDLYKASGMTALVDAVFKSQEDLSTTSQIYGDHAFLTFVLTDGQENRSRISWTKMSGFLAKHDENWTVGFLVPNQSGVSYMQRLGVNKDSVAVWDATSAAGLADSFETIKTTTDNFMAARATGKRGSKNVFATVKVEKIDKAAVVNNLVPLSHNDYNLIPVTTKSRINDFVRAQGFKFTTGIGYYQLTKEELVHANKKVIVVNKATGDAFSGEKARALIGLPEGVHARVIPTQIKDFDIFIQSTSPTRNLLPNTKLLLTHSK